MIGRSVLKVAKVMLVAVPAVSSAPSGWQSSQAVRSVTPDKYLEAFQQTATDVRESYKSFNAAIGGNLLPSICSIWNRNQANAAQRAKLLEIRKKLDALQASERTPGHAVRKYAAIVMATQVDGFGVGNCGELSAVVFVIMTKTFPELKFMVVRQIDGQHAFVLAKLSNGDIYAIDAWKGLAGGPFTLTPEGLLLAKGTTNAPAAWSAPVEPVTDWE